MPYVDSKTLMGVTFQVGSKDFKKAEEMYRLALDGYEKSLKKDHEPRRKYCPFNLAFMLREQGRQDDLQKVLIEYPYIGDESD